MLKRFLSLFSSITATDELVTGYPVSTILIRNLMAEVKGKDIPIKNIQIEKFLQNIPLSSNYIMTTSIGIFGYTYVVDEIKGSYSKSYSKLEDHIRCRELIADCKVMLSPAQYSELKEIYDGTDTAEISFSDTV